MCAIIIIISIMIIIITMFIIIIMIIIIFMIVTRPHATPPTRSCWRAGGFVHLVKFGKQLYPKP